MSFESKEARWTKMYDSIYLKRLEQANPVETESRLAVAQG